MGTEYPKMPIGKFAKVKGGKRLPKGRVVQDEKTAHPYIRVTDFHGGVLDKDGIKYIDEDTHQKVKRYIITSDDVFISIAGTIGLIGIVPNDFSGANLTENAAKICEISPNIDKRYLAMYLQSHVGQAQISGRVVGTSQPKLALFRIEEIEVPVPPLPTQRRIADILSAYDDLIENNTRRIRILEQMAQAIYQEWFGKVDKESLPEGWSISKFIDVCNELIDGDWIETKDQGGEDYRLLQVSNIGLGDFVETGNFRYVTQETFERLNCNEIIPGDILISRMPKPIGRGWLVTKMPWRMITAVDVAIARPNPDLLNNYYCIHWLNSSETLAKSEQHASGTTRPRITRRDLAGFEMVIPPIELQNKFGKIAKQLYELQTNLRRKNDNLRQTRDLLLPRLVSGEVEV